MSVLRSRRRLGRGWCGTTVVGGAANATVVSAKPTATMTLANAMGNADRTGRLDGMARLFRQERSRRASSTLRPPPSGGVCSNQASPLGGLRRPY